ncbi:MAG: VOC family protein [Dehalococcoidia bacterium]
MPSFERIDHVVIATADLEDATHLWELNLGLRPDATLDQPLGAGFKVARLPVGDAFLELIQPGAGGGRFAAQVQERGEGLFSLSIEVDDMAAAVAHLREKGATVSDPEPGIWPDSRVARVSQGSSHGVSIQLIERA